MTTKILKNFFTKSDFDRDCPSDGIFEYHPQIRVFLILNGIFFHNADSYIRFVWPLLVNSLALVGTGFELIFIYHGIATNDYAFATESFCYFITLFIIPVINTSLLVNRRKLMDLLYSMDRDFQYVYSLGSKYRNTFLKGQLLIWQLCILWFVFILMISFMYFSRTLAVLLYQSLFATQTEHLIRPLISPFWLPYDDPYRTPNYEVFLTLQIISSAIVIPQAFCVYIYILFHILLHYYYMMSMIIYDCEVLFNDLDHGVVELSKYDPRRIEVQFVLNGRMRRIVKWHNLVIRSIEKVSSIFGPPLVYQVMFSSLLICLTTYQVADSLDHGNLNVIFVMYSVATCVQLWIPCYLGTLFRDKAFAVGDALWSSGWHATPLGRLLRNDITLVIMRTQQPLTIKFTGLPNLDLETFCSIMTSAYSYFNLLRRYSRDNT
ncbi:odorant receptor 13a-like [Maniola jurtina]|uniref:odorant receptor 13a-like n=1 Tax=Maniola jurtina TaxID=191418 RepID=UPI001E687738|nr:odorant receptor 13a-like [Maniola jurtina]